MCFDASGQSVPTIPAVLVGIRHGRTPTIEAVFDDTNGMSLLRQTAFQNTGPTPGEIQPLPCARHNSPAEGIRVNQYLMHIASVGSPLVLSQ